MANYIIEGTISELKVEGNECTFKICGAEGFSIKRGDKKYNVLCPEKMPKEKEIFSSYVLSSAVTFSIEEKQQNLLFQVISANKRIRVAIKKEEVDKVLTAKKSEKKSETEDADNQTENKSPLSVSSITLLSD